MKLCRPCCEAIQDILRGGGNAAHQRSLIADVVEEQLSKPRGKSPARRTRRVEATSAIETTAAEAAAPEPIEVPEPEEEDFSSEAEGRVEGEEMVE